MITSIAQLKKALEQAFQQSVNKNHIVIKDAIQCTGSFDNLKFTVNGIEVEKSLNRVMEKIFLGEDKEKPALKGWVKSTTIEKGLSVSPTAQSLGYYFEYAFYDELKKLCQAQGGKIVGGADQQFLNQGNLEQVYGLDNSFISQARDIAKAAAADVFKDFANAAVFELTGVGGSSPAGDVRFGSQGNVYTFELKLYSANTVTNRGVNYFTLVDKPKDGEQNFNPAFSDYLLSKGGSFWGDQERGFSQTPIWISNVLGAGFMSYIFQLIKDKGGSVEFFKYLLHKGDGAGKPDLDKKKIILGVKDTGKWTKQITLDLDALVNKKITDGLRVDFGQGEASFFTMSPAAQLATFNLSKAEIQKHSFLERKRNKDHSESQGWSSTFALKLTKEFFAP